MLTVYHRFGLGPESFIKRFNLKFLSPLSAAPVIELLFFHRQFCHKDYTDHSTIDFCVLIITPGVPFSACI